jgi:hypothetical protein
MNKRQIIASLNKIANQLDAASLYKEANTLTQVMKRLALMTGGYLDPNNYPQFKELQQTVNEILGSHSGFSSSYALRSLVKYYSEDERSGSKEEYLQELKDKAETSMDRMDQMMGRDTMTLIEAAQDFQSNNNLDDETMKMIVSKLK